MMNHLNLVKNKFNTVQVICCQDDDDENDDNKDNNNILINDDINDDLIDFSSIPPESAALVVTEQQLLQNASNYADSSSSTSSLSSSSTGETLLNPILNIDIAYLDNQIENKDLIKRNLNSSNEFEILKSIESLLDKFKWSIKLIETECASTLIECESCDFLINITNFIKKFKNKLDVCFNNVMSTSSKTLNDLINFYLIKLIHIIFLKHECNHTNNNELILFIIKNFFKQLNKVDYNDDNNMINSNDLSDSTLKQSIFILPKIKKQLNDYLNSLNENIIQNFDNLMVNEYNCDNIKQDTSHDLIDCCQLNEEDALLNLENLIEDNPVNTDNLNEFDLNKKQTNDYAQSNIENIVNDEENFMTNFNEDLSFNKSTSNNQLHMSNYSGAVLSNEDNSSILKAINKRKLHLSCPICGSCVVNMSDHLVKKHSIRDRNQRKYLMDVVRKTYINESRTMSKDTDQNFVQNNQTPNKAVRTSMPSLNVNKSMSSAKTSIDGNDSNQPQIITNSNNRKFIKCPICLDDNKYFVNISDHLIKIHHLVTSESRKPILRQIKENALNYSLNKAQFDVVYSNHLNQKITLEQTDKLESSLEQQQINNYNYESETTNGLILNDNNQNLINEIFNDVNENDQLLDNNNNASNGRPSSKRKPSKSKKLAYSNEYLMLNENNNNFKSNGQILLGQDDEEDDEMLNDNTNHYMQKNGQNNKNNEDDDEEDEETINQDDDSDYCDLIALNYESLTGNNLIENNPSDLNQCVDFSSNNNDICFAVNSDDNLKKRKQTDANFNYNQSVNNYQMRTNEPVSSNLINKVKRTKFSSSANSFSSSPPPVQILQNNNLPTKLIKQQTNSANQMYDLVLMNETTVSNCMPNNSNNSSMQDFEINDDNYNNRNFVPSKSNIIETNNRNQKLPFNQNQQQLNKMLPVSSVTTSLMSPSVNSCTSPTRSNSSSSSTSKDASYNKLNGVNSANGLDNLWSKFNSIEFSLNKTIKGFNSFSENLIKQIQTFSNQFQSTLNELDSIKKSLVEATNLSQIAEATYKEHQQTADLKISRELKKSIIKRSNQSFVNQQRSDEISYPKHRQLVNSTNRVKNSESVAQMNQFNQPTIQTFNQDNKT